MAFKGVKGAGIEQVTLKKLLTSSNQDEVDIGREQWIKRAKENPDAFRRVLKNADTDLKNSPNKNSINYNNLRGFPKEVLDGIVPNTNAPAPKTVDDVLKAPSTAEVNTSSKAIPWGNESRISITPTRATPKPASTPSSGAPSSSSSSSSSAPYYYVREKDGTGKVTSKIYEGEDIYKAVPREAFGAGYVKKGAKAPKPSTTPAVRPSSSSKTAASSPVPKSVDSVIKPTSTPKPTPKVVTPSTVSTPVTFTPETLPIPSVSATTPVATPYSSLPSSTYGTVTPTPVPATRPVDSVIKPAPAPVSAPVTPAPAPAAPAPIPASTPVAPAPAPASTPASAPAPKTITTPKLFSVPASSTAPSPSLGPLPSTPSTTSTPVATPSGSPLSSSVYGKVTPTPASAPASASTASTTATPSTTSTPSSSAPPAPESAPSGKTSGPKPASVNSSGPVRPSTFVDASGKALKYGSRALLAAAVADDAIKGNDAGVLADLIMALGGRPGGIIGGILHPTELANSDLYINGVNRYDKNLAPSDLANVGLNGQSAGISAVAASREKENNQEMEDLFDTFSSLGAEPYGEVPFIMASNGVPYFQDEKGFTQQPYENPQSLSYTYFNGEQHPMNAPGEITDANRSISMPTKKATIATASTPATAPTPAPARRRRQATSPMEATIATPSPREQLAAQRAAALQRARNESVAAAAAQQPNFDWHYYNYVKNNLGYRSDASALQQMGYNRSQLNQFLDSNGHLRTSYIPEGFMVGR